MKHEVGRKLGGLLYTGAMLGGLGYVYHNLRKHMRQRTPQGRANTVEGRMSKRDLERLKDVPLPNRKMNPKEFL